jgi:hypothetical protein
MKTILLTMALATSIYAYTSWVRMTNTGKKMINYQYTECYYKNMYDNFSVSIVVNQSYCPYVIKYDPMSGYWKK